jgi:hypothetical protein
MATAEYKINRGQIAKIHVLLAQIGLAGDKECKAGFVRQYTDERETSTTKLTWKEAQDMITGLSKLAEKQIIARIPISDTDKQADRKRKLILHYAHQMGWENDDMKVDVERVNNWCIKYGQFHKALNNHDVTELSHLIVQFEHVYKDFLKAM